MRAAFGEEAAQARRLLARLGVAGGAAQMCTAVERDSVSTSSAVTSRPRRCER